MIVGTENNELSADYLENKISLIDKQSHLSEKLFHTETKLEETEKINTINELIPILKELIQIRTQEYVNFTSVLAEIKLKISSKHGEIIAKEKAVAYFQTLNQDIYAERITQYNDNLVSIKNDYEQLQALLVSQNESNDKKKKIVENLQIYLAWLEAESVKLQSGYGGEFGKYMKFEFPTELSNAEINQTLIDQLFITNLYNLANIEYTISERIIVIRKIIFYLQSYATNITLITTQFKSYMEILKSGQSKFDKLIKSVETELNAKESELTQNTELKEYYTKQNMEERANGIEESLVKIRADFEALQKHLAALKLSLAIYTHSIEIFTLRLTYRTQQLTYLNGQIQLFESELQTLITTQSQQSTTTITYSASESTKVDSIENFINELSTEEISVTTKILKITKIITLIKSQITVITKKYMQIKFEVQKLTAQQFKLKLSMGIYQAQYESYTIKITRIQTEISEFTGSEEQLKQLQSQLTLYTQQSETSWNQIQTLNITYTQVQTQIDNYLIQENTFSEQIIKYKEQLVNYQGQIKDLNIEQKKIEEEQLQKEKEKQEAQQENLEKSKEKIENMKEELEDKKTERDNACKIPQEPEVPQPLQPEEIVEEEEHPIIREEKEKARKYEPMEIKDEEELPKSKEPRIDGAQEGFDVRIPGNPYTPPKQRPEEEIWRKPKTDKRYDYGWEQFMREKEEEKKKRNLTLAQPQTRIPYENVEEGVYRIKRRLHDIMNYEFGNDEFFVQIKTTVEHYMKVLVEKEHVIKKKEIHIKERNIKIENTERRIEHKAEIVKQDLEKCQLDFPLVREKAEKIKAKNYTQILEKKIEEKKKELEQQKEENKKAEEEVEQLEEKVQEDEKQAEVREEKIVKTYPEEFHYEAPEQKRRQRVITEDEPLPDYVPTKSWTPPEQTPKPTLKEPETEKEKEQEQLTEKEEELDEQLEETEDPVPEIPIKKEEKEEVKKQIEEKEEEIKQEEKKIEVEKQKLVEEKEKLDQQIEQCKLDFGAGDDNLSTDEKEQYQLCVTNRDQFDSDKSKLEEQIAQYEQLFKELQDEKAQFQAQKTQMPTFTVSGAHEDRSNQIAIPVFSEIKKSVHKQALWKHINRQLSLVNDLAQSNAKQQKTLENKMKNQQIYDKEHLAAIKSMKYIQSFTEKIAAKLSLILSEYPEDREKLREMTSEVVTEIDRLYELAMKQRRIISSINTLREKQRELLTMKTNCLKAEKLMNQPSFLQNLLQMNSNKKRNFQKY